VVARGVALFVRGSTRDAVATASSCSRRTVSRWIAWFANAPADTLSGAWRRFARRVVRLLRRTLDAAAFIPEVAR